MPTYKFIIQTYTETFVEANSLEVARKNLIRSLPLDTEQIKRRVNEGIDIEKLKLKEEKKNGKKS